MSAQHDWNEDPRLFALALGELAGEERAALERELEQDQGGRAALTEIEALCAELARELEAELAATPVALSAETRARIARAARPRRRPARVAAAVSVALGAAAAAGIALAAWVREEPTAPFAYDVFGGAAESGRRATGMPFELNQRIPPDTPYYTWRDNGIVVKREAIYDEDHRYQGRRKMPRKPMDALRGLGYESDGETYAPIVESDFVSTAGDPLSTFSIDVDTASYANVRRFLNDGRLPPPDAVRVEEMLNYFPYDYPAPEPGVPFSVAVEVAGAPWTSGHRLVRIGLRGTEIPLTEPKEKNLVFLIDVSGSMSMPDKLPLLKRALALLVESLSGRDRIAIVTYAGESGVALPATPADRKAEILAAIEELAPGGMTHGSEGIELAYWIAETSRAQGGVNRVVLCTDGDFNVGVTDDAALVALVERKRRGGVELSVLGFGTGNLQDAKMERLADHGNGNYAYVDTLAEARKVLVREIGGTLETIAKDVKIQVEFDPARVESFRRIGYENRALAHADFEDDAKDAGEIGAGHRVTALYEVVPRDGAPERLGTGRLGTVRLRYKEPDGDESRPLEVALEDDGRSFARASADLRFAAGVAGFGMVLRGSQHVGELDLHGVHAIVLGAAEPDPFGYRTELVRLVERALALRGR